MKCTYATWLLILVGSLNPAAGIAQLGPLNWTEPVKVESNNLFVLWQNEDTQQANQKIFDLDFRNDTVPLDGRFSSTLRQEDDRVGASGFNDVATGKFVHGARESVVAIWNANGTINIMIPDMDTSAGAWANAAQASIVGSTSEARCYVRSVDIDGDGLDEFLVSYVDPSDSVQINLYDVDSLFQPTLLAHFSDEQAMQLPADIGAPDWTHGATYRIETGDFDGDGDGELALLRLTNITASNNASVNVKVYDLGGGAISPGAEVSIPFNDIQENTVRIQLGLVAGNFVEGLEDKDELVVIVVSRGYDTSDPMAWAQVLEVGTDLQTIDDSNPDWTGYMENQEGATSMDAGNLFGDDRDEVVLAAGPGVNVLKVDSDNSLDLFGSFDAFDADEAPSQGSIPFGDFPDYTLHQFMQVSDMDQNGKQDIMLVYDQMGPSGGFLGMAYSVNPDSLPIQYLSGVFTGEEPATSYRPYSIALGNFDGMNFTIGEPTHSVAQGVVEPIVVLNAPPVHFDKFGSDLYDLNECYNGGDCDFQTTYVKQSSSSIEVSATEQSDWAISAGLSVSGSVSVGAEVSAEPLGVGASVSVSVSKDYEAHLLRTEGAHFSNTSTSGTTVTIGVEVTAKDDDRIFATVTDYDVWEYPVYHGDETFPRNTILTVVPQDVTATWFASKSYTAVNFVPDHEVGNVLSYEPYADLDQNPDLAQPVAWEYSNSGFQVDASSSYDWSVGIADFQSNTADTTRESGWDIGVGSLFRFDGDFTDRQVHTRSTSVSSLVNLNVHLGSVDMGIGDAKYTVKPYAYWDKKGALVVDYAAEPEVAPPGFPATWWETRYGQDPDPTFVLPWRLDPEKGFAISEPAKRQQTKDIFFSPEVPYPGDTVTITARVRNFSLVPTTQPVSVSFYLGDPDAGGTPIIGLAGTNTVATLGPISAQGRADAHLQWVLPSGLLASPRIYAVIDEGGLISEVHEENNKGFNVMAWSWNPIGVEEVAGNDDWASRCFPNPFSGITTIQYRIPHAGRTTIKVLDQLGREVATLVDGFQTAGIHSTSFDATDKPAGLYLYSVQSGEFREVNRMMLVK